MTSFYKDLKVTQKEPRLWVKRVVLYGGWGKDPVREVPLRKGINVIWAHEPDDKDQFVGVESAGHGVGKTSFCLLLRYCLCDKSKAVDILKEELSSEYPEGGVAAVVSIKGEEWSIFRPYAKHRRSIAVRSSEISDLFQSGISNTFQAYEESFSEKLLSNLESDEIPATGQKIQWHHLLSWLTRDQSARFLNYYHWREGEGSKLQRPKEDPPILLRLVLGLISEEEVGLLDELTKADRKLSKASDALIEYENKPAFILSRIEADLREWGSFPEDLPFQSDDLFSSSVVSTIREACKPNNQKNSESSALERSIEKAIISVDTAEKHYESCKVSKEILSAVVRGSQEDLDRAKNKQRNLLELAGHCPVCDLLYSQCSHVQEETNKIDFRSKRDQANFSQMATEYAPKLEAASGNLDSAEKELTKARAHLAGLRKQQNVLRTKLIEKQYKVNRAKELLEELEIWEKKQKVADNPELHALKKDVRLKESSLNSLKLRSKQIRQNKSERETQLSDFVESMAKILLGEGSYGVFDSEDLEFPFKLTIGCEAFRVLSVLLGDFSVLLLSSVKDTGFPGFLLHDCPREADMSEHLYQQALELLQDIEVSLGEEAPFQYILTTTTPPPESLYQSPYVRLELRPDCEESMLFRRRFQQKAVFELFE